MANGEWTMPEESAEGKTRKKCFALMMAIDVDDVHNFKHT